MIQPEQMCLYDDAAKQVEKAVNLLWNVNVAKLNPEDVKRLHEITTQLSQLRQDLFHEAYDAFLRARGLKE